MGTRKAPWVYLVAQLDRQAEMRQARAELEAMGLEVHCAWLDRARPETLPDGDKKAAIKRDEQELLLADLVLVFADDRTLPSDGTQHFLAGIACTREKPSILVGPRDQLHYHHLHFQRRHETWDEALKLIFTEMRQRQDIELRPKLIFTEMRQRQDIELRPSRSCRGDTPRDTGEGGSPSEALPDPNPNNGPT